MADERTKIRINERCMGKTMFVVTGGGWFGEVKRIIDSQTFELEDKDQRRRKVNIYDIRDPAYFE